MVLIQKRQHLSIYCMQGSVLQASYHTYLAITPKKLECAFLRQNNHLHFQI